MIYIVFRTFQRTVCSRSLLKNKGKFQSQKSSLGQKNQLEFYFGFRLISV